MKEKIVGIIPARGGSGRLKDKNILPLCGKPLIFYTIEAAQKAKSLDRIIVSTDSEKIAEVARKYGVETIIRPAELATDTASIDDALRHVVIHLEKTEGYQIEIVVLMQANIPIRAEGVIDKVVSRIFETDAETVTTAYEVNQRPEWMKRIINDKAVPYMQPSEFYRMQDLEKLYLIDGAVTAVRTHTLMRTQGHKTAHAYMGQDIRLELQDRLYSIEIDDLADFRIAELLLQNSEKKKI